MADISVASQASSVAPKQVAKAEPKKAATDNNIVKIEKPPQHEAPVAVAKEVVSQPSISADTQSAILEAPKSEPPKAAQHASSEKAYSQAENKPSEEVARTRINLDV